MKEKCALLLAQIEEGWKTAENLWSKIHTRNLKPLTSPASDDVVAAAYELHNLYCALEDIFLQVARAFENQLVGTGQYHRELLRRMKLDVPRIRPAFLSENSYRTLDELRAFRHIFRHAYGFELRPEKVAAMREVLLEGWPNIAEDKAAFCRFLTSILGN